MDTLPRNTPLRVVVLKEDRLFGDLIQQALLRVWPKSEVLVYRLGFDALQSIQDAVPDLFITGVKVTDMDGLEHLEPFVQTRLPILIVTSRADARTFRLLSELRYNGIFDCLSEGIECLPVAIQQVMSGGEYASASFLPALKPRRNLTLDALTAREEMVLAVVGDGSDDNEAANLLGMSPATVATHRKSIMRKLGVHQKGYMMRYAFAQGYLHCWGDELYRPGFQRLLGKGATREPRDGNDASSLTATA